MSQRALPATSGIYTLIIDVAASLRIEIGKLGCGTFPEGLYAYTGSAIGATISLLTRVGRHLAVEKKKRWHIDYLLTMNLVNIKAIVYVETIFKKECQISKRIARFPEAKIVIRGFGSSDCHCGCGSHLYNLSNLHLEESISRITEVYGQTFCTSVPVAYRTTRE